MLVSNATAHCFVLSAGVIIQPNAANVSVADATYAADSTLNSQLDALEAEGFVSISGKPADSFPPALATDPDGQVVLSASAADKLPLKLVAHNGQTAAVLEVVDEHGAKLFQVLPDGVQLYADDNGGNYNTFYTGVGGSGVNQADAASPAFQIWAQAGASANLFEAYDEDGLRMVSIDPSGVLQVGDDDVTYGLGVLSSGGLRMAPPGGMPKVRLDTSASQTLLVLQAVSGQTGNLFEAYDEDGVLRLLFGNPFGGDLVLEVRDNSGFGYARTRIGPGTLEITNADGDEIFRVDADGSVHIKTGGTIHADL